MQESMQSPAAPTVSNPQPPQSAPDAQLQRAAWVNGAPLTQWPADLYIPPEALEVFLEMFQGPLDLLLYLIRRQNLDILDIPVAHITRQYMEYVELMRHFRLDLAAEYLVMAAILTEIKSRMLLPRPLSEEEDTADPRAALVRRLQEYERFNQAAQELDAHPRLQREVYLAAVDYQPTAIPPILPTASVNDLVLACRSVLARSEQNKPLSLDHDALNVREKMTQILARITAKGLMRFEDLLVAHEGRTGVVVCFIAILELVRDDMLVVVQNQAFSPIHVQKC